MISYGADADVILVTARRASDAPASDQSIVPVLKGDYTLERTSGWDTMGMRGTCSDGFVLRATGDVAQVMPTPYAEISAQTMLPTTHLTWAGVWLGIASDAVARARAFVRAEARRKPGTTPSGAVRLAETVGLLQFMRANVVAAAHDYARAMESAETLTALSFAVEMNNVKTGSAQMATAVINHALLVCGLAGYRNDGPYASRHP